MTEINEIIKRYIEKGFGSMTKNDFEVWIFGQILKMDGYRGKTNYELSIALRIPESKVKRLRYESALRNAPVGIDYKQEVMALLGNAQLRADGKKIIFQVEDVLLKSYISSVLKKEGRMLDSSFNPELVVLNWDDFQYLAKEVYPIGEMEKIIKEAKKIIKDSSKKELCWNDMMGWVVKGTVSGVASGLTSTVITNLTPVGIINTLKNLI